MVLLFRRLLHVLSLGENKNHEEKIKILEQFSHIKKEGCNCGEGRWQSVFILLLLLIIWRLLVGLLVHFLPITLSQLCSFL